MKKYRFVLLLFLLNVVGMGEVFAQVLFIPPYARLSLTYYDGGEQEITQQSEEGSSGNGSVYERSSSLSNFGVGFAYGVFTSHQTRLQVEGNFLFWQNNNYEWRDPPGLGLTLRNLRFTKPGSSTKLSLLLMGYYDFNRLNPYANGSWTPYVGGGFGIYGVSRPVFDLRLASDSEIANNVASTGTITDATVLDSNGKATGTTRGVVLSSAKTALSVGPLAAIEMGVSYNFNNYILDSYARAEYLFSLRKGFPSELILTLNFGIRL